MTPILTLEEVKIGVICLLHLKRYEMEVVGLGV